MKDSLGNKQKRKGLKKTKKHNNRTQVGKHLLRFNRKLFSHEKLQPTVKIVQNNSLI